MISNMTMLLPVLEQGSTPSEHVEPEENDQGERSSKIDPKNDKIELGVWKIMVKWSQIHGICFISSLFIYCNLKKIIKFFNHGIRK